MDTKNMANALDDLVLEIGKEDAVKFFLFALPILIERRDAMIAALMREDWNEVSLLADKTLGTVRTYDDGTLETMLKPMVLGLRREMQRPSFVIGLRSAFDKVFVTMLVWLEENRLPVAAD